VNAKNDRRCNTFRHIFSFSYLSGQGRVDLKDFLKKPDPSEPTFRSTHCNTSQKESLGQVYQELGIGSERACPYGQSRIKSESVKC
jgi:hypothetical protein